MFRRFGPSGPSRLFGQKTVHGTRRKAHGKKELIKFSGSIRSVKLAGWSLSFRVRAK